MGGADVDSAERYGPGSIASTSQLLHNARKPALGPRRDVFDDEPAGARLVDNAEEVVESESAPGLDSETGPLSGSADVLAGESAAENIDVWWVVDGRDIGEPLNVREVLSEHACGERVDLALPGDARRNAGLDKGGENAKL
jgi:hypothetical protein